MGIDRDLVVVKKARDRVGDEGRRANVEFIHTDLLTFHADRSFDAVVDCFRFANEPLGTQEMSMTDFEAESTAPDCISPQS
jgi:hypothetical protein